MAARFDVGAGIPNRLRSGKNGGAPCQPPLRVRPETPNLPAMDRPDWRISDAPVPYEEALSAMEARVAAIRAGQARELVWLLEHPPIYTAGTSARA